MKTALAALALLSAAAVSPLVGQGDNDGTRATLAGLTGVYVLVEHIDDDAQRDGLDTLQVRTDVEVKLRQASISVLSEEEQFSTAGAGDPFINNQNPKNKQNVCAVSCPCGRTHGGMVIRHQSQLSPA